MSELNKIKIMTVKNQPAGNKKSFWTSSRLVLTIVVLSLISLVGVSSCTSNDQQPASGAAGPNRTAAPNQPVARNQPPVGLTALPPNVRDASMRSLDGTAIKLSNYAGKVVLVNLWATWCGPCRNETPELVKLHKEFQAQGVEMVGLTNEGDPRETAESVQNFVRDFQVDYQIGWATPDVMSTLMQGRDSIPQSFIISRDGKILKRFIGFSPSSTPPQIRQAITDALSGKG